tara:strand:- start:39 stop:626 length:588 start_codon:yes stop_codon:yes gene_type:complete
MAANTKYRTAKSIANKIARDYKELQFDVFDVVEWCAEAEKKIGQFEAFAQKKADLKVENKKAELPCDVYRILSVYRGRCKTKFHNDGCYLNFPHDNFTAQLEYLAFPTDPDGYPIIKKGHEDACYWYCLTKLLFPDYVAGKIDHTRWEYIQIEWNKQWTKAKANYRDLSRNDMDEIAMCVANIIPHIKIFKDITY